MYYPIVIYMYIIYIYILIFNIWTATLLESEMTPKSGQHSRGHNERLCRSCRNLAISINNGNLTAVGKQRKRGVARE